MPNGNKRLEAPRLSRRVAYRALADLAPDAAAPFLREAFGTKLVQVIGRCAIEYRGRASSELPAGDRLVLLKPDGTLLVHTATKLKPVNWQPPGCEFQATVENDRLVVSATRDKPRETVRMVFEEVHAVAALELADGVELALVGTEDDLQAALARSPDAIEPGFTFWRRERASGRGPMDLYGVDARGRRVVVEVKRRAATVGDVEQLRRYVEREKGARGDGVRGILVAPTVSETARRYLADLALEWREIDVARLVVPKERLRAAGQSSLAAFGRPSSKVAKSLHPEKG